MVKDLSELYQHRLAQLVLDAYSAFENDPTNTLNVDVNMLGQYHSIQAYTINNGQPVPLSGQSFKFFPLSGVLDIKGRTIDPQLPLRIGMYLLCIDTLCRRPSRYRDVFKSHAFCELYRCGYYNILRANGLQSTECLTCNECGYVLPRAHFDIDHQRPQSGGENEALLKMMRVLGLTKAGPHGKKCLQLQAIVRQALAQEQQKLQELRLQVRSGNIPENDPLPKYEKWLFTNDLFIAAWQFMDDTVGYKSDKEDLPNDRYTFQPVDPKQLRPDAPVSSTLQDRYTLNEDGIILYSIIRELKMEQEVFEETMHSLVNLRPLCGPCNKERGNRVLKFPTSNR